MATIFDTKVKTIGKDAELFKNEDTLILFGNSAPEELKDYCYSIDVNPILGEIQPNQVFKFDNQEYTITAVGSEAPVTLKGLGHCTIRFNGSENAEMPGTIYVERKPMPDIQVGTKIQIIRKE